jgi:hypothetical protein
MRRMGRTLFALMFRPGYLTREYLAGRRRRYVRPGRLFLVLAIGLFATLRLTTDADMLLQGDPQPNATTAQVHRGVDNDLRVDLAPLSAAGPWLDPLRARVDAFNRLPDRDKLDRLFFGMTRYGPYAMVALLPMFAALMMAVYVASGRRRPLRPRLYAAHLVFAAHEHAFVALALLCVIAIPLAPVRTLLLLWLVAYLPLSMKAVYGGPWLGVLSRAALLSVAYIFLFAAALVGLVAVAIALR